MSHFIRKAERGDDSHCVNINLSNKMIWCYKCDEEIDGGELAVELRAILSRVTELPEEEDPKAFVMEGGGFCGFSNLGNTCYLNSALQCLVHSLPLTSYFLTDALSAHLTTLQVRKRPVLIELLRQYRDTLDAVWRGERKSISPRGIVECIQTLHPPFRGYGQQDSQEFIRALLDHLHEGLKVEVTSLDNEILAMAPMSKYRFLRATRIGDGLVDHGIEEGCPRPRDFSSIVSDVFEGMLVSSVKCKGCSGVFKKVDCFMDISVSIPSKEQRNAVAKKQMAKRKDLDPLGASSDSDAAPEKKRGFLSRLFNISGSKPPVSLYECLHVFCLPDSLTKDNKYDCGRCKAKTDASKSFAFLHLPEVLVIHIKRFNFSNYWGSKKNDTVVFPEYLDMSHFLSPERMEGTQAANFSLFGVINHHGSFGGGHYTSFVRNQSLNRWLLCDDSRVYAATLEDVLKSQAYVLFYQREDSEAALMRQNMLQEWREKMSFEGLCYISKLWKVKLESLLNPGPVLDIVDYSVCSHGKMDMNVGTDVLDRLFCSVPRSVYQSIVASFGGPEEELRCVAPCLECAREREELSSRRELERRMVMKNDNVSVDQTSTGLWYLLDTHWLNTWKEFVNGLSNTLPGPVDNSRLLDSFGVPVPNMRVSVDYRGINELVWNFFLEQYGGGPEISRRKLDLYGT